MEDAAENKVSKLETKKQDGGFDLDGWLNEELLAVVKHNGLITRHHLRLMTAEELFEVKKRRAKLHLDKDGNVRDTKALNDLFVWIYDTTFIRADVIDLEDKVHDWPLSKMGPHEEEVKVLAAIKNFNRTEKVEDEAEKNF